MDASVVIITRNRKEELRRALRSVLVQNVPIEVIILDDGSTDGTAAMVSTEFSQVRLHSFDDSRGLIVRRNQAAALATADILVSIDDDAEFSSPNVIERTLKDFSDRRIGAVAI